jgi:hypothetical protein
MVKKISNSVWVEAGELKFGMNIGYASVVQTQNCILSFGILRNSLEKL